MRIFVRETSKGRPLEKQYTFYVGNGIFRQTFHLSRKFEEVQLSEEEDKPRYNVKSEYRLMTRYAFPRYV